MKPPQGGADLECLLSCRMISNTAVRKSVEVCQRNGFELVEGDAILLYEADPIEPVRVAKRGELAELLATLQPDDFSAAIIKLEGKLSEYVTPLGLFFSFQDEVVEVSIPEDALWAPNLPPEHADLRRLHLFGAICRD